jgi:hypothetical protein
MKAIKLSCVALAISITTGCSSMLQKNDFKSINEPINEGDIAAAAMNAEKMAGEIDPKSGKSEDLIWALHAGTLNYATGNDKRTVMYFDSAEKQFRDENSEGVVETAGETTGAVLVNDAVLDYEPSQYDMVYTNHYKAMSLWKMNNESAARVEFNRSAERQRRAANHFAEVITEKKEIEKSEDTKQVDYSKTMSDIDLKVAETVDMTGSEWKPYDGYVNPAVTYANALFFMLEGKSKSDFNKAADGFKRVYGMSKNAAVKTDLQMAQGLAAGKSKDNYKPTVWVIHEDGLAPKKSELRFDLPIFLLTGQPQMASYAIPKMGDGTEAFGSVSIDNFTTQEVADVSKIIKAEFKEELPVIKARAAASTISKVVMQAAAAEVARQDDSGAGAIFQVATMLYSLGSTSADIRTNVALPNSVGVTRLPKKERLAIKAGPFEIPVQTDPNSKYSIIYVRTMNAVAQPTVSVINI